MRVKRTYARNGARISPQGEKEPYLQQVAKAPSDVSGLLEALQMSDMTGGELRDRLERAQREKHMATFSRDLRDPNMLFNRATDGQYTNLEYISPSVRSRAEMYYDDLLKKLAATAYVKTSGNLSRDMPMYRDGEIERSIENQFYRNNPTYSRPE